jgi:hypothetical protein
MGVWVSGKVQLSMCTRDSIPSTTTQRNQKKQKANANLTDVAQQVLNLYSIYD